jgi:hypothetical protein
MSIDSHLRQPVPMKPGRALGADSKPIDVAATVRDVARTGNTTIKRAAATGIRRVNCGRAVRTERPAKQRRDHNVAKPAEEHLFGDATAATDTVRVKVDYGWITLTGQEAWYYRKAAEDRKVRQSHGIVRGWSQIVLGASTNIPNLGNRLWHRPQSAGLTDDDRAEFMGPAGWMTSRTAARAARCVHWVHNDVASL